MALTFRCDKHDIGYVVGDIYPVWWSKASIPDCPICRLEWIKEHEHEWDFPISYEVMLATADWEVVDCLGLHDTGGRSGPAASLVR